MEVFELRPPTSAPVPLLVSIPHTGTEVPDALARRFSSATVAALPDTDWHLHRLYDFAPSLGATTVYARYSRYVIDLNRAPDNAALYPGRSETGLVPTSTFHDEPIYKAGDAPTPDEIAERRRIYWEPYHAQLKTQLERLKAQFGYALLFDAHSITGVVPRFHKDPLPGLMLGDVDGTSALKSISDEVYAVHQRSGVSHQRNQPFKGGYITRHFGRPQDNVHALQLEMSQRLYMDEAPPFTWREDLANTLRPVLKDTLRAFISAAQEHPGKHS